MANLPPDMPLDSAMIEQAMLQFSNIPEKFHTIPMHMEFSEYKSFMTPDYSSFAPGMNLETGLSQLGMNLPLTLTYTDHREDAMIMSMQIPSFDESSSYLISQKIEAIDWVLVDTDSTILGYPVKKAKFASDTLNAVAWYSPEIPTMAGPMFFGGFPGLPLLTKACPVLLKNTGQWACISDVSVHFPRLLVGTGPAVYVIFSIDVQGTPF